MNMLIFATGTAIGVCFGAVCMYIVWIVDVKDEHKRLHKARHEAYQEGYSDGKRQRLRTIVLAEKELETIKADIEEIKNEVQM